MLLLAKLSYDQKLSSAFLYDPYFLNIILSYIQLYTFLEQNWPHLHNPMVNCTQN